MKKTKSGKKTIQGAPIQGVEKRLEEIYQAMAVMAVNVGNRLGELEKHALIEHEQRGAIFDRVEQIDQGLKGPNRATWERAAAAATAAFEHVVQLQGALATGRPVPKPGQVTDPGDDVPAEMGGAPSKNSPMDFEVKIDPPLWIKSGNPAMKGQMLSKTVGITGKIDGKPMTYLQALRNFKSWCVAQDARKGNTDGAAWGRRDLVAIDALLAEAQ